LRSACNDSLMVERNWAGNVEYGCPSVNRPRSTDELRELVARSTRVRVLGTRHAFNDIADCDVLVNLEGLPEDIVVDTDARSVALNPGVTYGRLASVLHEHGMALHNLASLPHISVAGAIATATHGSGDRLGNLATAVTALDVLRSDGEIMHLDRGHPDFDGAVVNLGSLGVMLRVTLAVQPAYEVAQTVFEDLAWDALATNLDAITAAGDSVSLFTTYARPHVEQVWVKRRLPVAAPAPVDLFGARAAASDVHPIAGASAENCTPQLDVPGPWWERLPHFKMGFTPSSGDELQSELFVARADALAAIDVLRGLAAELAPSLQISEIRTIAADSLWMSPHYERDSVAFHFTWRRDVAQATSAIHRVETALSEFAPRPHWGKLFTIAARYPRQHDFVDLLERLDPDHKFRNAWFDRVMQ
jgi:xylitol oxidase